jgi:uncharacterized protein (DUF983 family)
MPATRLPLEPPGLLWRVLRTLWLVTRLRCPVCGLGRLRGRGLRVNARCLACGVVFERSPGEFTGGMGLNSVATCFGVGALAFWVGYSDIPLELGMAIVALFAVAFPILFYVHSRALWVGILHIAGLVQRDEGADPEPVIRPWPQASSGNAPQPRGPREAG